MLEQLGTHDCPHPSTETVRVHAAKAPPRVEMHLPSLFRDSRDSPTRLCPSDVLMGMNGVDEGVPCLLAPVSRADGQGKVGEAPSHPVNPADRQVFKWARPLASPSQMGELLLDWGAVGGSACLAN